MRCPYCGAKNSDKAERCHNCGRRLSTAKQEKKEKKIVQRGVLLVVLVAVLGVAGIYFANEYLVEHEGDDPYDKVKIEAKTTTTPEAGTTETDSSSEYSGESQTSQAESSGTEDEGTVLSGSLVSAEQLDTVDLEGYVLCTADSAEASSELGSRHGADRLIDDSDSTNWQEDGEDEGIGESVTIQFDRTYSIHYIAFKLGSWRSESSYKKNNRPRKMTIEAGGESFDIDFEDIMEQQVVRLSEDVDSDYLKFTIDSVYSGSYYKDDTAVTAVDVYGS